MFRIILYERQIVIGRQARMTPTESMEALDAAVASWSHGKGEWATADMKVDLISPAKTIGIDPITNMSATDANCSDEQVCRDPQDQA
jgi:hypothetical protein